jgi:hypothetical protein
MVDAVKEIQDLVAMLDRYDKTKVEYGVNARDVYLAEKIGKYSEKEYEDLIDIIAVHWSTTDDCDDEHGSIVMDIVCALVFMLGDFKRFDFFTEGIESSGLRDLLTLSVTTVKELGIPVSEFKDAFTNVYDQEVANSKPTKEEVNA